MSVTERVTREMLDNALPYQVAVDPADGAGTEGTLRRLFCANLNIGPGHETAVVHDLEQYLFCFADIRDAMRFRDQFGGKLSVASAVRTARFGSLARKRARVPQTCLCL